MPEIRGIQMFRIAIRNKMSLGVGLSLNVNSKLMNDALANLLDIEFITGRLTRKHAQQNFETLR